MHVHLLVCKVLLFMYTCAQIQLATSDEELEAALDENANADADAVHVCSITDITSSNRRDQVKLLSLRGSLHS